MSKPKRKWVYIISSDRMIERECVAGTSGEAAEEVRQQLVSLGNRIGTVTVRSALWAVSEFRRLPAG